MALSSTAVIAGQERPPLLSVRAELAPYGIESAERVVRGRVSVVESADGHVLQVYFLRDSLLGARPEAPEPPPPPETGTERPGGVSPTHAVWVWNTREILADPQVRRELLGLVEAEAIGWVFLYLPAAEGTRPEAGFIPFDGGSLGPLVGELRERGALVYGLDGDPAYALPENHAGILRTVERVARHNRDAPAEQRLHGVRYDIEPYLLEGFQGPGRQAILDGYVTLVSLLSDATDAAGLALGVDIPFWLDAPDEESGEPLQGTVDGERRGVLGHLLSLVDDVAIMDYRTRAFGPGGAVAMAMGELRAAAEAGVAVFVGVETMPLGDEVLYTFSGGGSSGLPPADDDGRWIAMAPTHGEGVVLWLAEGPAGRAALAEAVDDPGALRHWPAGRGVNVDGDALSFHDLGPDVFDTETQRLVRALAGEPAFRGLAFHDYRGLSRILSRK